MGHQLKEGDLVTLKNDNEMLAIVVSRISIRYWSKPNKGTLLVKIIKYKDPSYVGRSFTLNESDLILAKSIRELEQPSIPQ